MRQLRAVHSQHSQKGLFPCRHLCASHGVCARNHSMCIHVLAGKFFATRALLKAAKPRQMQDTLCPNYPDASAHVADDEAKCFAAALSVAVCFCRSVASAMALPYATTTRSRESVKTVAAAAIANTASASAGFAPTCLASCVLQPFLVRDLFAFCCARLVHYEQLIVACLRFLSISWIQVPRVWRNGFLRA